MAVPTVLKSLHSKVFTSHWRPVIAGIAVTTMGGILSAVVESELLLFGAPLIGGLVAGFLFGKYWKHTAGIGFRVGVIGATLVIVVGLLLMAGGFWKLPTPEFTGTDGIYGEDPGFDEHNQSDVANGFAGEKSGPENGSRNEYSTSGSMTFLTLFSVAILIPASALSAMIGCAVGTNVRRAVVPDEYNPPLF